MLYQSPITVLFIGICVIVWFLINMNGREDLVQKYALIPWYVRQGQWYRIFTVGLIHIQIYHLVMNMYSLYNLGSFLEPFLGHFKFLVILVLSIIGGSLMVIYFGKRETTTVGISGGLYGLLGAYIILLWRAGLFTVPSIRYSIIQVLVVNALISLMPNVSLLGHLGGMLVGLLLGFLLI
ncbi:MAG: rhomboid family intramembrane serine protease [Solobacterium sp.]|nr:rhomboid family intramembrane serine protease [Solobacterium sp.]